MGAGIDANVLQSCVASSTEALSSRRLLFVVNTAWFFVSHRLSIAVAAKAAGDDVHVATPRSSERDGEAEWTIGEAGIVHHRLGLSRGGAGILELFRDCWCLIRLFRAVRPDVVHLVTLKPVLLGGIAARVAGVRSVVMAISGRGTVFSARGPAAVLRRWLALLAYRIAYRPEKTRVIFQNIEDRDYFYNRRVFRPGDSALIRGSGVDIDRFTPSPEPTGDPVVVFAARMLKEKGVADFVRAAWELRRRGTAARFVLIGEPDSGSPLSHTKEEIEEWVASGAVEWWGHRNDMEAVFANCHIVCLPTYYGEGLPKVLIEAAAAGRAIVTTNTPGCRDIVRHGYNGVLVPKRDAKSLVRALETLIDSERQRRSMGMRGARLARRGFALHKVVKQTLELYATLE